MGYSARYHAFSIIAVFAALAVGIVLGAGLGDELVSGTTKSLEESLKEDVKDLRAREDDLTAELDREADFGVEVYPDLVAGRLRGDSVGVIALGEQPEGVAEDVSTALGPTGASIDRDAVVRIPPDLGAISDALGDTRLGHLAGDPEDVAELGEVLGRQLARGGALLRDARGALLDEFSGGDGPVDRIVLMRSSVEGLDESEQQLAGQFERGIMNGIRASGVPAVAVERRDTVPSSVLIFDAQQIPTVDSVDLTSGRVAMVFALLGAQGNYGVKETADTLLPQLLLRQPSGSQSRHGDQQQGP